MSEENATISFRLKPDMVRRLEEEARGKNMSRHECARDLLTAALASPPAGQLLSEVQDLTQSVENLKAQLRAEFEQMSLGLTVRRERSGADQLIEISEQIKYMHDSCGGRIEELHEAFATGIKALLLTTKAGSSLEEVDKWIREHILRPRKS